MQASPESKRKEIHDSILTWLDEAGGYTVKDVDKKTGFHYYIEAARIHSHYPYDELPFSIEFPTTRRDSFQIIMVIPTPEEIKVKLNVVDDKRQNQFLWDVILSLITNNCLYKPETKDDGFITKLTIWEIIYFDGCNKDRFMQAIRKMLNSYSLIVKIFEKYLEEPRPRPESDVGVF
jgi:hypothetical protein